MRWRDPGRHCCRFTRWRWSCRRITSLRRFVCQAICCGCRIIRGRSVEDNEFGLAPHTDTSFMTMLAQNEDTGIVDPVADGRWLDAPALPGSILVNGATCCAAGPTTVPGNAAPGNHPVGTERMRSRSHGCDYDWRMECLYMHRPRNATAL